MRRYTVTERNIAGGKNWNRRQVEVQKELNPVATFLGCILFAPLILPLFLVFYPIVGCLGPNMERRMQDSQNRHEREVRERSDRQRELDRSWMSDSQFNSKY